jgi:hypothetical protein
VVLGAMCLVIGLLDDNECGEVRVGRQVSLPCARMGLLDDISFPAHISRPG